MPNVIDAGTIVQVTMVGNLFNQRVMNVLHYQCKDITGEPLFGGAGLDAMWAEMSAFTGIYPIWLDCMTDQVDDCYVQLQIIHPLRYAYRRYIAADRTGTFPGTCTSANTSASLLKRSLEAGARGVGRMQMFGLASDQLSGGYILHDLKLVYDALAVKMAFTIPVEVAGSTAQMAPIVFHRENPAVSAVVEQVYTQETIRTQRTRTIGRGE